MQAQGGVKPPHFKAPAALKARVLIGGIALFSFAAQRSEDPACGTGKVAL
jgi:hypothetical protein